MNWSHEIAVWKSANLVAMRWQAAAHDQEHGGVCSGSGVISAADIEKMVSTIEQAVSDRSYLALAPQFVVTATR
ncbi:MAG: hypothetical protein ACLQDM_06770 [Bradyrhizobium sp.]